MSVIHHGAAATATAAHSSSSTAATGATPRIAPAHWKQSLKTLYPSLDVDAICTAWQQRYEFAEAQREYLSREVEEILESNSRDADAARKLLRQLEQTVDSLDWYLCAKIGSGAFGAVYRGVRRRDNFTIAVKIIDLEETSDDIMTISREIVALTQGQNCEQLTNYYGSVVLGTKLWIGMQYLDGGSVFDFLKHLAAAAASFAAASGAPPNPTVSLDEEYIAIIVREVLLGLAYLAKSGKIHRDIKCANVLLSKAEGRVQLADFGASRELTSTMAKCNTFVGSPYWMAPEVMMAASYDGSADIWSQFRRSSGSSGATTISMLHCQRLLIDRARLGITCIEMTTGKPPYSNVHALKVMTMITRNKPPELPADSKWSADFRQFVAQCLVVDVSARPSIQTLLKHPFILSAKPTSHIKTLWDLHPQPAQQ